MTCTTAAPCTTPAGTAPAGTTAALPPPPVLWVDPQWRGRDQSGWCVRLQWPNGTHDLGAWRPTAEAARRTLAGMRRYWSRPGLMRPVGYTVVASTRQTVVNHCRTGCREPGCPR